MDDVEVVDDVDHRVSPWRFSPHVAGVLFRLARCCAIALLAAPIEITAWVVVDSPGANESGRLPVARGGFSVALKKGLALLKVLAFLALIFHG